MMLCEKKKLWGQIYFPVSCKNYANRGHTRIGDRFNFQIHPITSLLVFLENKSVPFFSDGTDWLINARGLIDSLRQTWETAVEDVIAPVLRTFSSKINTKGFGKLSAISLDDAEEMRNCYGRLSELLHKTSDEMNPIAPEPSVIQGELNALESWIDNISERQSNI